MGRIRQAEGVGTNLHDVPLPEPEITDHAQVQAEVSRTAELIAVGVSEMSVSRAGNERCSKGGRVEEVTSGIALAAGLTGAQWSSMSLVIDADEIGGLRGAIRVQVASGVHGEGSSCQN